MAQQRTKIKLEDVKSLMIKVMNVHNGDQGHDETYVYQGTEVDEQEIPAMVVDELKKLGFLNPLRIELK